MVCLVMVHLMDNNKILKYQGRLLSSPGQDYSKPERQRAENVVELMKNLGDIPYAEMRRFLNEGRIVHGNLTSTDVTKVPPLEP